MGTGLGNPPIVPIDVSDPAEPSAELPEVLHSLRVVVRGCYPVPDQSSLQQIPDQLQGNRREELDAIAEQFAGVGTDTESVLVFTRDHVQSIDRVANTHGCDAVPVRREVADLSNILVSLKDEQTMFRVLEIVRLIMESGDPAVTLVHAESIERGSAKSELFLRGRLIGSSTTDSTVSRLRGGSPPPKRRIVRCSS